MQLRFFFLIISSVYRTLSSLLKNIMWYKVHRLYLKSVYSCTCVVRNLAFKERYGLCPGSKEATSKPLELLQW